MQTKKKDTAQLHCMVLEGLCVVHSTGMESVMEKEELSLLGAHLSVEGAMSKFGACSSLQLLLGLTATQFALLHQYCQQPGNGIVAGNEKDLPTSMPSLL